MKLLHDIAFQFNLNKPDTTLLLAQQAFQLSKKIDYPSGVARALNVMAMGYVQLGDFAKALTIYNSAKEAYAKIGDQRGVIVTISNISDCYMQQGDWPQALKTMRKSYQLFKNRNGSGFNATAEPIFLSNLGEDFYNLHQLDSASYYLNLALPLGKNTIPERLGVLILYTLGDVAMAKLQNAQAKNYYREAVDVGVKDDNFTGLHESYFRWRECTSNPLKMILLLTLQNWH